MDHETCASVLPRYLLDMSSNRKLDEPAFRAEFLPLDMSGNRQPPFASASEHCAPKLLRVDLRIVWILSSSQLGRTQWVQCFQDGVEVADARPGCPALHLRVSYSEMVSICYEGLPFEAVIPEEEILRNVALFSCVSGLLHHPTALRLESGAESRPS